MKEYLLFLKDKSVLSALVILLLVEISLQAGCYKSLLKKNSYASNVNRITDHAISRKKEIDPDILIMGTSLAYEGISVRLLNEKLVTVNLKAQSIAIPGAELLVQQMALEKALVHFKNVKYIIHVNEPETPWTVGAMVSLPTLAMASSFNQLRAIEKFKEDEYAIGLPEISYILIKLWAYRHDIADFILGPEKRIKDIGRAKKVSNENLYAYENANLESLELYSFRNLEEALAASANNAPIAHGSNQYHKEAIFKTSKLAKETNITLEETESTRLFKKRISNLYGGIKKKNIKIINVFPPLSSYVKHFNHKERITFWKKNFQDILGEKILDLSDSIPQENNASYFYDMVHPNQKGMNLLTEKLGNELLIYLTETKREAK